MFTQIQRFMLFVLPLGLVACTQGQESFSTEPGKGYGWKDMTETQKEVHKEIKPESFASVAGNSIIPVTPIAHPISTSTPGFTSVARIPEQFIKIWFAPYQDPVGNLHEECAVHTVLQTGQWVVPKVEDHLTA